jgi:hypothetical protein
VGDATAGETRVWEREIIFFNFMELGLMHGARSFIGARAQCLGPSPKFRRTAILYRSEGTMFGTWSKVS